MLSAEVTDHYRHPRSVGTFPDSMAGTVRGTGGSIQLGRLVELALRVGAGTILEARFKAFGCPSTIACGSALADRLGGIPFREAARITALELAERLALEPAKLDCALAAEDALKAALAALGDDLQ